MKMLTEQEYNSRMEKIKAKNLNKERLENLKKEKNRLKPKFQLPSTSKLILLGALLLCFEILLYAQYVMIHLQDTSAMYVLIGIPASLIPIILGYFNKAKAENTQGGIVYDTAMAQSMNNSEL